MTHTGVNAEPIRRAGGWWTAAFTLAWLGIWTAQLGPVQLVLPEQVKAITGGVEEDWASTVATILQFGVVAGVAAIASLIAYPLAGALSDRTTGRWGRRRPWIAGGTLLFAGSLLLLAAQTTIGGVIVCWALASVGFCALSAALTAMISDQIPVAQRGFVSGLMSAPQGIGVILGVVLAAFVFTGAVAGYTALAVLLVVLVIPFLLVAPDAPLPIAERPAFTARALIQGFWISPRKHPDFGWTLLSRILVNVANALGTSLLLYFLLFGLGREASAEEDILILTVIYALTAAVAAIIGGRLSDRLGRRRMFVLIAAGLQAVSALLLALAPAFETALVSASLSGIGYGAFLAVDQALATQVLPDAASRGKDLGIMNIASAIPQGVGPMLGALVIMWAGGFWGLFLASAVIGIAGALAVLPIRSVR